MSGDLQFLDNIGRACSGGGGSFWELLWSGSVSRGGQVSENLSYNKVHCKGDFFNAAGTLKIVYRGSACKILVDSESV